MPIKQSNLTANVQSKVQNGVQPFTDAVKNLGIDNDIKANSWFAVGNLESNGHKLAYMFHVSVLRMSKRLPIRMINSVFSLTDSTTGWYQSKDQFFAAGKGTEISTEGLHIKLKDGLLSGDLDDLQVQASADFGSVDLHLRAIGFPLYNAGTGYFRIFNVANYQYSIPTLETTGTIQIEDTTYDVNGTSWFDRQYADPDKKSGGNLKAGYPCHWVWMNLTFNENDDKLSLWGAVDNQTAEEYAWVTILHADGSHEVVEVKPLSDAGSNPFKSEYSGSNYPTIWDVEIPAKNAQLHVAANPLNQEIKAGDKNGNKFEGASVISGIYDGTPVTGDCFIELVGPWK